jgi:hypothetical protein
MGFILIDETEDNVVHVTEDINNAVDEAHNYQKKTGKQVEIYITRPSIFKEAA